MTEQNKGAARSDTTVETQEGSPAPVCSDVASLLPVQQQRSNLLCFAVITFLIYLSAPVLYVDVMHTTLCDRLGASKAVANLPSSAAVFLPLLSPLIVWAAPQTRMLIPMMVGCFAISAALGGIMCILLLTVGHPGVLIAGVVTYGGIAGLISMTVGVFRWEALARGVSEGRRGGTLSLAFGIGPLFAVLGSMGAHFVLNTDSPWFAYPRNYALLFGVSVPTMAVAAVVSGLFRFSHGDEVTRREPLVPYLFGGLIDFLRQRHFLILSISFILASSAMYVMNNASLYMKDAADLIPQKMAGMAVTLRFGGKVLTGLALGYIYTRLGARSAVMATSALVLAAVVWILTVKGRFYMAAFSLFGGGELLGAYYYTYVVAGSPAALVKRNSAFLNLAFAFVAAAPYFLGRIADHWGLPASFAAGLVVAAAAFILLAFVPARPEKLLAPPAP